MELAQVKERIAEIEGSLDDAPLVELAQFDRGGRTLRLALTSRLRRIARKNKVWKSKGMLSALKNAQYCFSEEQSRSRGGSDGVFLLDRDFKPPNAMMRRMFQGFLDKGSSEADAIAEHLGVATTDLRAVRLVSHHTRLLGVLAQTPNEDWVVLVDLDPNKRAV